MPLLIMNSTCRLYSSMLTSSLAVNGVAVAAHARLNSTFLDVTFACPLFLFCLLRAVCFKRFDFFRSILQNLTKYFQCVFAKGWGRRKFLTWSARHFDRISQKADISTKRMRNFD